MSSRKKQQPDLRREPLSRTLERFNDRPGKRGDDPIGRDSQDPERFHVRTIHGVPACRSDRFLDGTRVVEPEVWAAMARAGRACCRVCWRFAEEYRPDLDLPDFPAPLTPRTDAQDQR